VVEGFDRRGLTFEVGKGLWSNLSSRSEEVLVTFSGHLADELVMNLLLFPGSAVSRPVPSSVVFVAGSFCVPRVERVLSGFVVLPDCVRTNHHLA
jgi:hypothetical protein